MNIREAWEASLTREGHVRDAAQEDIVAHFEALQQQLVDSDSRSRGWFARLRGAPSAAVKGLYIWGGVGRGKTFLMDLFYETLAVERKRRVHFHRIMQEVHNRLRQHADVEDPLDLVAEDIARDARVLCFDEFFVSDIGDAMILGRLLEGLFKRGVTLVTTSNSPPDNLYKGGLQRSRFLPAIEALKKHTQVVNMDAGIDYRLRLLAKAGTYLTPDDADAEKTLLHLFDETASTRIEADRTLSINGRDIVARRCAKSIVWFDFDEICDGPRSQADYIELSRWYPEVIVSGVPVLDKTKEDQARRFIALVDEFYDRRVKLILSAAAGVRDLYVGKRLGFEFDRTTSRLIEMQSTDYLAKAHLCD